MSCTCCCSVTAVVVVGASAHHAPTRTTTRRARPPAHTLLRTCTRAAQRCVLLRSNIQHDVTDDSRVQATAVNSVYHGRWCTAHGPWSRRHHIRYCAIQYTHLTPHSPRRTVLQCTQTLEPLLNVNEVRSDTCQVTYVEPTKRASKYYVVPL